MQWGGRGVGGRRGILALCPQCFSIFPWPHRDITVGKYKARLHKARAYLDSESMWDMPRNKRPSLRLGAGRGDLFQQPQIALCFLNWQGPATFDGNDMQLAASPGLPGRPPFSRKVVLTLAHKQKKRGGECSLHVCVTDMRHNLSHVGFHLHAETAFHFNWLTPKVGIEQTNQHLTHLPVMFRFFSLQNQIYFKIRTQIPLPDILLPCM